MLTREQNYERGIIGLANGHGKFAIEMGYVMQPEARQKAFERLQIIRWVRLIDVSPIAEYPHRVMRIFLVSAAAQHWFDSVLSEPVDDLP